MKPRSFTLLFNGYWADAKDIPPTHENCAYHVIPKPDISQIKAELLDAYDASDESVFQFKKSLEEILTKHLGGG